MSEARVICGDCREVMATLEPESIDAVVTDPPYALGFMGKEWDSFGDTGRGARVRTERAAEVTPLGEGHSTSAGPYLAAGVDSFRSAGIPYQAWCEEWARECLRVLKPGGYLLAFGGTRTVHRLTCAIEDAGFEIRDTICYLYGSGFPKSLAVGKAIDKAAGAERDIVGTTTHPDGRPRSLVGRDSGVHGGGQRLNGVGLDITAATSEDAKQWDGWGTALKPAHEPIIVARKPLIGTVAANVLEHGTGALNIDRCRIETSDNLDGGAYSEQSNVARNSGSWRGERKSDSNAMRNAGLPGQYTQPQGRWPANVVLDEQAAAALDQQSGARGGSGRASGPTLTGNSSSVARGDFAGVAETPFYGDMGGASRFFYTAKASRSERGKGNDHPTVKPMSLMRWLVRLVTPPGGTVLDPFTGSGTTIRAAIGEGFNAIGIEIDPAYIELCHKRINGVQVTLPLGVESA